MVLKDIRTCPTRVINLDRRTDRWGTFSKQPLLGEFKELERFSAVDGSKLDVVRDDRVSVHTRQNILTKTRRSHYEICTAGAIGASLSHLTIWEEFLKGDAEYLVVFEDDTIVDTAAMTYVDTLIPKLPESWDMWLLGCHRWAFKGEPMDEQNPKSWWRVKAFTGAHAYVLSRRGAQILLQEPYPIETHIEYYISACSALKGLVIIKHWALRMSYFAETTDADDSDTFDGRKNCPVCYIPDNYPEEGLYIPYWRLWRMLVGLGAVGVVGYGAYLGFKKGAEKQ
jgi:hypothetical protein